MICNEIAARLETQCRRYLYKKLGICAFLHPQKQISCENHNPTHKGRRTPENKLTGEASKKISKTKRPYQARSCNSEEDISVPWQEEQDM
jgi:hypothetical protein